MAKRKPSSTRPGKGGFKPGLPGRVGGRVDEDLRLAISVTTIPPNSFDDMSLRPVTLRRERADVIAFFNIDKLGQKPYLQALVPPVVPVLAALRRGARAAKGDGL